MAKRTKKASDIKVAVVGYGAAFNMGRLHLEQMREAGMTPVAVADADAVRLRAAERDFPGIETYATLAQMLKRSAADLVTIITPHNTHAKLALQCLRAGRHVVCEKPFAVTTAECDRMIAEARRRRLMVTAYHNRHWDGCILEATRQIGGGAIGRVVRIEARTGGWSRPGDWWRSSRAISGGVLYDWGVHYLEYALQLIDTPLVEVSGHAHHGFWAPRTRWKKDTNEDDAGLVARFRGGPWLTLGISHIDASPRRAFMTIVGTEGTYLMDHGDWELIQPGPKRTRITRGRSPATQWSRFYANVAAHLSRGEPLVITPEHARRPIHILDLAVRSARAGRALRARHG